MNLDLESKQIWIKILALLTCYGCDAGQVNISDPFFFMCRKGRRTGASSHGCCDQTMLVKVPFIILAIIVTERFVSPPSCSPFCVYFMEMCCFLSNLSTDLTNTYQVRPWARHCARAWERRVKKILSRTSQCLESRDASRQVNRSWEAGRWVIQEAQRRATPEWGPGGEQHGT